MTYESSVQQWRDGLRRLEEALVEQPAQGRILDRVSGAIYEELRRRLGSTFTTDELVELYEGGTAWAQQLAMSTAPEDPQAWEPRIVVDAAFGRYVREAADYAGGRRLIGRPQDA
jgi:hypothetical protein